MGKRDTDATGAPVLVRPEPLRHLSGTWSRRLTDEHRLTYRVTPEAVEFLAARYHYR